MSGTSATRPHPVGVKGCRARATRGPREDGRWYWRASRYEGGRDVSVWVGWAHPEELPDLVIPVARDATVAEVFRRWMDHQADVLADSTWNGYAGAVKRINLRIGTRLAVDVTADTVSHYRATRLVEGGSESTVRSELRLLTAAWEWAVRAGLLPARNADESRAPCFECGRPARHEHHVIPRAHGGKKTIPLCEDCHTLAHRPLPTRGRGR